MPGDIPPNYGQPDYSHHVQAEAEALKFLQGAQSVGRGWATRQAEEEQRRRAAAAAGRIAMEQTTQRF